MSYALQDLKVISLGTSVSAPLCARYLADLGADVIKVERPSTGDFARGWDEVLPGMSSAHLWCNPNKRSIVLNLKAKESRQILGQLVENADVFIENFSPGVVDDLGIGYHWAKSINSEILYCHISGYGQDGPYRDMKALDMLIQGEAGAISVNGSPEEPAKIALSISDASSGMFATISILAALQQRHRTGEGQEIDVSMFDCTVSLLGFLSYQYLYGNVEPTRVGLRHHLIAPYGPWISKDGKMVNISAATPSLWESFCNVIKRPDLFDDPRFLDNTSRVKNLSALDEVLAKTFIEEDASVWLKRLRAAGIPCGAVNRISEVIEHAQTKFRLLLRDAEGDVKDNSGHQLRLFDFPVRFSKSETRLEAPPGLGAQTDDVLTQLGYSIEETENFRRKGIVE